MGRTNESLIVYELSQKALVGNNILAPSVAQKQASVRVCLRATAYDNTFFTSFVRTGIGYGV
jgi:hypothetical protein